jgi:hypothetical protein
VQRRQRIDNGHLDRLLEPHAQVIGIALAFELSADASQQLIGVDRADDIIVDAHIEPSEQPRVVAGLDDAHDRQVPRAVKRPNLRAKPQAVGVLKAEADDHEVEIAEPQQCVSRV